MGKRRVGVLMGGMSAEREVSLRTGDGVATALEGRVEEDPHIVTSKWQSTEQRHHGIWPPVGSHDLKKRPYDAQQRMMRAAAPPVGKPADRVLGEAGIDQRVIRRKIASQDDDVAQAKARRAISR